MRARETTSTDTGGQGSKEACPCGQIITEECNWICCINCFQRYHLRCIDLTKEEAEHIDIYEHIDNLIVHVSIAGNLFFN